jgi:hypothetical protein
MTTSVPGMQESKPIESTGAARIKQTFSDEQIQEMIRLQAYQFYQERGCVDGHDLEDWVRAEAEVSAALGAEVLKAA